MRLDGLVRQAPREQVLAVGLAAALLQGVIVHTALTGLSRVQDAHDSVREISLAQRAFQDADMAHDAMQARLYAVLIETGPQPALSTNSTQALDALEYEVDIYRTALGRVATADLPPRLSELAREVRQRQDGYAEQVLALGRLAVRAPDAARDGLPAVAAEYEALVAVQDRVTMEMADEAGALEEAAGEESDEARLRLVLAAVATVLGLLGLTYLLTRLARALSQVLRRQRGVVETLQQSLLPDSLPTIPGVELAVRYLPGGVGAKVGGDWYDVVQLPGGEVGLVMGDVVGHDLHAATEMGQLRSALRAYATERLAPHEVLQRLNRLCATQEPAPMATLLYAVLDPVQGTLRVANAGHCPPLVRVGDRCHLLTQPARPPVGAVPEVEYLTVEHPLPPGCLLVLYTDGLVERRGVSLDEGLDRLCEVVPPPRAPLDDRCSQVVEDMLAGAPPEDDVALMLVAPQVHLGRHLELQWEARMDQLAGLRRLMERWLAEVGADEDEAFDIVLSSAEAATNAVEHAYGPSRAQFRVTCDATDDVVTIVIRDWGRWRAPRGSDRGRGLTLIHALMDEARVDHGPDGTEVSMRKRLARAVTAA